jgi:hypothetical protein
MDAIGCLRWPSGTVLQPVLGLHSRSASEFEEIARVEVSSEDPQHSIESAFKHGESLGWGASQPGEQTIRLLF